MKTIKIHPNDNVAVALQPLAAGEEIRVGEQTLTTLEAIPQGHKIALSPIAEGAPIIKYGTPIGRAKTAIPAGAWAHTHNVRTGLSGEEDYVYKPKTYPLPEVTPRQFMGFRRKDGRAAIRNEIWIIPTVGCVNSIASSLVKMNQDLVDGTLDGIYSFSHPYGCSQLGDDHEQTKRILTSLARHPNAAAVLVLGLGCENLTLDQFKEALGDYDPERVKFLLCQSVSDELAAGSELLAELADYAKQFTREPIDASELIVGLKCGGSDGLSGITANPTIGRFSDRLIALGGSTILSEVPEMFGAEPLLLERCASRAVFDKAGRMLNDFKNYFLSHDQPVYENPSPGNKAGGITTLEDKSCGCVQKGGHAPIVDVIDYGERVTKQGLTLLSSPGNDLVSTTALTAAGAHLLLFSTGRGTPYGSPVPTVKISTNNRLYEKKGNWIDFNAGTVAEGESLDAAGERLLDFVIEIANGRQTRNEEHGFREISIFKTGVVL